MRIKLRPPPKDACVVHDVTITAFKTWGHPSPSYPFPRHPHFFFFFFLRALPGRRGYEYANHVTGYDMQLPGQEGFSVIKYGNTDEYRPHCDGDCTGVEYIPGGRVATMVGGRSDGGGPTS